MPSHLFGKTLIYCYFWTRHLLAQRAMLISVDEGLTDCDFFAQIYKEAPGAWTAPAVFDRNSLIGESRCCAHARHNVL